MKKVFQTIVGVGKGNCMQAVTASLLELPLEEVPHFISYGDKWFTEYYNFLYSKGWEYTGFLGNPRVLGGYGQDRFSELRELSSGFDGFYDATVYSPNYFDGSRLGDESFIQPTHAVIIDADFNIVHDPNPAYQGLKEYPLSKVLGYNGIKEIYLIDRIK